LGDRYNCIVYFNMVSSEANNYEVSTLNYCCATPNPGGVGNITTDPLFVNATKGGFRLRPGSPCIDTGTNLTSILSTDTLGLPRPMDCNCDGVAKFDMEGQRLAVP
jgi:hypothetical protein